MVKNIKKLSSTLSMSNIFREDPYLFICGLYKHENDRNNAQNKSKKNCNYSLILERTPECKTVLYVFFFFYTNIYKTL